MIAALGYLYQGDYSIPIILIDELKREGIEVVDLSLGAMKAASLLQILQPDKLIILTCDKKGRKELRVYSPKIEEDRISSIMELYSNVRGYYMDLESFLKAANSFGVLPKDTTIIECEVENEEGITLSEWGKECKDMMKNELKKLLFVPNSKEIE
jgi:hypothetical protein